jgi:hypothetical protein
MPIGNAKINGDFAFISPEHFDSAYELFESSNHYAYESGNLAEPVAGPPGEEVEILELEAPTQVRIYTWTVKRTGAKPRLPDPATSDPNEVIMRMEIAPQSSALDAAGRTPTHTVKGRYTYQLLKPVGHFPLRMGGSPVLNVSPETLKIDGSDYDRGIQ